MSNAENEKINTYFSFIMEKLPVWCEDGVLNQTFKYVCNFFPTKNPVENDDLNYQDNTNFDPDKSLLGKIKGHFYDLKERQQINDHISYVIQNILEFCENGILNETFKSTCNFFKNQTNGINNFFTNDFLDSENIGTKADDPVEKKSTFFQKFTDSIYTTFSNKIPDFKNIKNSIYQNISGGVSNISSIKNNINTTIFNNISNFQNITNSIYQNVSGNVSRIPNFANGIYTTLFDKKISNVTNPENFANHINELGKIVDSKNQTKNEQCIAQYNETEYNMYYLHVSVLICTNLLALSCQAYKNYKNANAGFSKTTMALFLLSSSLPSLIYLNYIKFDEPASLAIFANNVISSAFYVLLTLQNLRYRKQEPTNVISKFFASFVPRYDPHLQNCKDYQNNIKDTTLFFDNLAKTANNENPIKLIEKKITRLKEKITDLENQSNNLNLTKKPIYKKNDLNQGSIENQSLTKDSKSTLKKEKSQIKDKIEKLKNLIQKNEILLEKYNEFFGLVENIKNHEAGIENITNTLIELNKVSNLDNQLNQLTV